MPDTLVLRFRDAGKDTIANHRRLITAAGYVWWGWWKKEWEPSRLGELAEFRDRVDEASPLTIGLFDRSSEAFFVAELTGCSFGSHKIGSPESDRTPAYYADAKVAAWFKLSAIEEVNEDGFRERFGDVPIGDATFFPVWFGKGSSISPEALTSDVVQLPSNRVLHISDIHLGADFGFPSHNAPGRLPLTEILARDLDDLDIGLVIVSGDITTRAEANILLGDGLTFMQNLAAKLNVTPERIIIVPGNHDIALKTYTRYDYSHERAFHTFMSLFHGNPTEPIRLQRFKLPSGRVLEILPINSVRLRKDEEKNFGYIEWHGYDDYLRKLEHDPDTLRIAVLHHHLVPALREESLDPEYPEASVSTTLDAGAVIEGLQSHGFCLALHGHQHVPAVSKVSRGRLTDGSAEVEGLDDELLVAAAGSAGAGAGRLGDQMRDNSFNLITLGDTLEIEARRYTPGFPPRRHFRYVGHLG